MKTPIELSADLVIAQSKTRVMDLDEIILSLEQSFAILTELIDRERAAHLPATETIRHPADSIRSDHVVCLECGQKFQLLANRHLALHGLTPRTYKQKHELPLSLPLSSGKLTAKRKKIAKANSSGEALANWRAAQKEQS